MLNIHLQHLRYGNANAASIKQGVTHDERQNQAHQTGEETQKGKSPQTPNRHEKEGYSVVAPRCWVMLSSLEWGSLAQGRATSTLNNVQQVSRDNFGPLIAFLLPGFVLLWGIQAYSPTITAWLAPSSSQLPTVGGFLYATLASTAVGLILSAVRWGIVDTIYHHTGIPPPRWNFTKLPAVLNAFESLVEAHYHFYQFYANMLVALVTVYLVKLLVVQRFAWVLNMEDILMIVLSFILILGSRDALWKYYRRTESVLKPDSLHSS